MQTCASERRPARVTVRRATSDDIVAVWRWNNAPDTRAVSGSSEPIPWKDHCIWFANRLTDPSAALYIIEVDGRRAGTVRIEGRGAIGHISIAVAAAHRGRGCGRAAIEAACRDYTSTRRVTAVAARIHPDNLASQRCFERAAFRLRPSLSTRQWRVFHWRPPTHGEPTP